MSAASYSVFVEDLVKTYRSKKGDEKHALRGIDLKIPHGSFCGLLGPNGAGKSTLINILAGLVVKSSGQVSICGYDIDRNMQTAKRHIGVVPQELFFDAYFPVYEALEYTAGYYGLKPSERRTQEIIEAVGLQDKAHSPARSLSGGMKRRLLVAKALCHNPKVLVLDEPTAGVDVELRHQLWEYVKQLHQSGTTILLTTHYLEEAEELCDHITVINHGKIIANDSKAKIIGLLSHKKLIITPHETITTLPKVLKDLHMVLKEHNRIECTYDSQQVAVETILKAFKSAALTIKDLSSEESYLEDIFRFLTKAS